MNNDTPSTIIASHQNAIALGAITALGSSIIMSVVGNELADTLNSQTLTRDTVQMFLCKELSSVQNA